MVRVAVNGDRGEGGRGGIGRKVESILCTGRVLAFSGFRFDFFAEDRLDSARQNGGGYLYVQEIRKGERVRAKMMGNRFRGVKQWGRG